MFKKKTRANVQDLNINHAIDALGTVELTPQTQKKLVRAFSQELKARANEKAAAANAKAAKQQRQATAKSIQKELAERAKADKKNARIKREKIARTRETAELLGYRFMYKDGICDLGDGAYSQTITFPDISYQSAREDRQLTIFSAWQQFYNIFGENAEVQLSIQNTLLPQETIGKRAFFDVEAQESAAAQGFAREFNAILNQKMKEGISNIVRTRTITYTVHARNLEEATHQLATKRSTIIDALAKLGCEARVMTGEERLASLSNLLRPEREFDFSYDRDISFKHGISTKDAISPSHMNFSVDSTASTFTTEDKYAQVLVIRNFGSDLEDHALADIIDLPIPMNITWHVEGIDKAKARNLVQTQLAFMDAEMIRHQRQAFSKGYDYSIVPQNLKHTKDDGEDLLDMLEGEKDERLFHFTGLIYTYAPTLDELNARVMQIIQVARMNSIEIETYNFRQQEAFHSLLPLGHNICTVSRHMTSSELAILIPFATQELDMAGGCYVGQNKYSSNLVICNRKAFASPVAFICGKTGSGKSFYVKQEIMGNYLNNPHDQFIIFDRAGEYSLLANSLSGQEMRFAIDSNTHLNPFDMATVTGMSTNSQVAFKVDAILAQAAASAAEAGSKFDEAAQSILTRTVEQAYSEAFGRGLEQPLLQDFYNILKNQPEEQARNLALRYERYVESNMNLFNHESNLDWSARCVNFNIKELPENMSVFALINLCEAARNQMYRNFEQGRRTWIYVEEIQSLLRYPTVITYFSRFANEARKFGGLITGITQNATAMLENEYARPILLNADVLMLLKQSALDRASWTDLLALSAQEESFIDETADRGSGLLIAGSARVPIQGAFPQHNELYRIFSTDPNEQAA